MRVTWMIVAVLALSACGGGAPAPQDPPPDPSCTVLGTPSPAALTAGDSVQVQIEVRFLSVTDAFLDSVGVDFDRVLTADPASSPGFGGAFQQRATYAVSGDVVGEVKGAHLLVPQGHHPGSYLPTGHLATAPGLGEGASFVQAPGEDDQCLDLDPLRRLPVSGQGVPAATAIVPTGDLTPGVGVAVEILDAAQAASLLDALAASTGNQVLTTPSLRLYDGQRAISVGQTGQAPPSDLLPIVTGTVFGGVAIDHVTTGITLDVRPRVSATRDAITLWIRPLSHAAVAVLPGPIAVDGSPATILAPVLVPTTVETMVMIPDGGTLLIGGLKDTAADGLPGVPLLGRLPYVNRLFQPTSPLANQESLMIMITPRIITQTGG